MNTFHPPFSLFKMRHIKKTTKAKIKSHLRLLWLRSIERSQALQLANYSCQHCGVKQSKAKGREQKVEVHHKSHINNWDLIAEQIMDKLLCPVSELEVLCPICHREETNKQIEAEWNTETCDST